MQELRDLVRQQIAATQAQVAAMPAQQVFAVPLQQWPETRQQPPPQP